MIKVPWTIPTATQLVYKAKAIEVLKNRLAKTDDNKKQTVKNTDDESEEEDDSDSDSDDSDESSGSSDSEESEDTNLDPDELEAIYETVLAHDKPTVEEDGKKDVVVETNKAVATEVPTSTTDIPSTSSDTANAPQALVTQTAPDTPAALPKPVRTFSCSNGCGRDDLILH
jgi:hypothetical protein